MLGRTTPFCFSSSAEIEGQGLSERSMFSQERAAGSGMADRARTYARRKCRKPPSSVQGWHCTESPSAWNGGNVRSMVVLGKRRCNGWLSSIKGSQKETPERRLERSECFVIHRKHSHFLGLRVRGDRVAWIWR